VAVAEHGLRPIAPGVLVATSVFWSTTTTVLAAAGEALVVDPGVLPGELDARPRELARAGLVAVAGACTHAHWDHVLWPEALHGLPRYASPGTRALLSRARGQLVDEPLRAEAESRGGAAWPPPHLDLAPLADGQLLDWPGPDVVALVTDAHLPGHTSLLAQAWGTLVVGDLLSDVDVPFPFFSPPDADPQGLGPYRAALDRLAGVLAGTGVEVVVPGHGSPTDRAGAFRRLDADRRYLDRLEEACDRAATTAEALDRARLADGPGRSRLDDPAVRAAHDATVAALVRRRPGEEGTRPG
jgi:glyoxylase-like metal-dependent hydrolase (beta-lactamase superfamily II)